MSDKKSFLDKVPIVGDLADIIFGSEGAEDAEQAQQLRVTAYRDTDARTTSPEVTLTASGFTSRSTAGKLNLQSTSELRNAGFSQATIEAFNSILAANNQSIFQEMQAVRRRTPLKRSIGPTIKTGFMGSGPGIPKPITYKDKKDIA